jgi:hypothetical protein
MAMDAAQNICAGDGPAECFLPSYSLFGNIINAIGMSLGCVILRRCVLISCRALCDFLGFLIVRRPQHQTIKVIFEG